MSYYIDPWIEIRRMQRDMDNLFNNTLRLEGRDTNSSNELATTSSTTREMRNWRPKVDVTEAGDNYIIHAELPGCKKEDVSIDFNENNLIISGERSYEKKHDSETYHHSERSYGKFSRTIPLPKGINHADIKATYDHGVLEVTAPKPKEQIPQKITIS